jgi:preprotein translocase subunit SecA
MDYLKEGIGLRAMAQRDPLVEYQREGFDMFGGMLDGLKEESVGFLFNLQVEASPAPQSAAPAASEVPLMVGGNGQATGRRARPEAPPVQPAVDGNVPPALRGKGLGDQGQGQQRLTYSGPSEAGGVEEQRGDENGDGGRSGSTRRERREQARSKAKSGNKRPRR